MSENFNTIKNVLQVQNNFYLDNQDEKTTPTINARDLHAFLEVGRDFSNWIKQRIQKYEFKEGVDFVLATLNFDTPNLANQKNKGRGGDRRTLDYYISLDMAKELSMVENNEKGKIARRYFIECEKKLKQQTSNFKVPQNYKEALLECVRLETERELLQIENKEIKEVLAVVEPKADAFDKIGANGDNYTITQAAKIIEMPRHILINYLLNNRWLFRQNGKLTPYKERLDKGEMLFKVFQIDSKDKINCFGNTYITSRGLNTLTFNLTKRFPQIREIRKFNGGKK